jgi:cytochrome P450
MSSETLAPPTADQNTGLDALSAVVRQRSLLPALEIMHAQVGDIFQITLPSFKPVVLAGPDYARQVLVTGREDFCWRNERDPLTSLLRHGILVEDGESHRELRALMEPTLHRRQVVGHVEAMRRYTELVTAKWDDGATIDMATEMRLITLLILVGTLFGVEIESQIDRLWKPILRAIAYISPGLWIIWPGVPRPGYRRPLRELDDFLYRIIEERRLKSQDGDDLLSQLIASGMSDDLIRDQLLTMLIAGHDTSTAMLSWALYLLGRDPASLARAQAETDAVLGAGPPEAINLPKLTYLDQVIKETLRLYPSIHVGNRQTRNEVTVDRYTIPADTRLMLSIYLTHRDEKLWDAPAQFRPQRFDRQSESEKAPPFAYLPFGGGPRNCIGAAFAQVEGKVVLAHILQNFDLQLVSQQVRLHMGATLDPRPGVMMQVHRRIPYA